MMKKKIFISSTCFDLLDLRSEIKDFISSSGLIPIMSDQLDSEFQIPVNTNSIETCLINLRESDAIIIILSQRYGPSLKNVGFEDLSATHLEYKEALKENKKVLFFIRDRLMADYQTFQKTKDKNGLLWTNEKNIKLFDFIKERESLSNSDKDNWRWIFRDSLDIKERLKIELKDQIMQSKLDSMIETGNMPFIYITPNTREIFGDYNLTQLVLYIENCGNQPAFDTQVILFEANSYKIVIKEEIDKLEYTIRKPILLLRPNIEPKQLDFDIKISDIEINKGEKSLVIECIYKTIHGYILSDIMELKMNLISYPKIEVDLKYVAKRYVNQNAYNKMILNIK